LHDHKHFPPHPRGLLKVAVLKLISESPKNGTEIMNEIEKRTFNVWKPSPGSIYPLLADLERKGLIREVEEGSKRYTLTENGERFLKEVEENVQKERLLFGFLFPPWFEVCCIKDALYSNYRALWQQSSKALMLKRKGKLPKDVEDKVNEILRDAHEKLKEVLKDFTLDSSCSS